MIVHGWKNDPVIRAIVLQIDWRMGDLDWHLQEIATELEVANADFDILKAKRAMAIRYAINRIAMHRRADEHV